MKTRDFIIFIGIPTTVVFGVIFYKGFVTHNLDGFDLVRALLVLSGLAMTVLAGSRKRRALDAAYRAVYGDLVGNAFANAPELKKLLYKALKDLNHNRHAACLKKLDKLRLESPRAADRFAIHAITGMCYSEQRRYEEAIAQYTAALQIRENAADATKLGNCHMMQKRTGPALECYLRAVRADSRNADAHSNLAVLYTQLGQFEKAIEYGEKTLAINARSAQALSAMAIAWAMLGNDEQSEAYFRRATACGIDGKELKSHIRNLKA